MPLMALISVCIAITVASCNSFSESEPPDPPLPASRSAK
jgi:hypothetical protein